MNNIKQTIIKSLSFLDNSQINLAIVIILILYCSQLFSNINNIIEILYKYDIVKFLVLLVIAFVAHKDTNIAILLAVSYAISILNKENFIGAKSTSSKKTSGGTMKGGG